MYVGDGGVTGGLYSVRESNKSSGLDDQFGTISAIQYKVFYYDSEFNDPLG